MTEREAFVAWLDKANPRLPTTHDVRTAWRGWLARAETACTCDERTSVTDPMCPACGDSYEEAADATPCYLRDDFEARVEDAMRKLK